MSDKGKTVCGECNGSGQVAAGQWGARPPRVRCSVCRGEGTVDVDPGYVPYGATGTGHSGSTTSIARQQADDATGRAGRRRRAALQLLAYHQSRGMTAGEMEEEMRLGHGPVSSVLSHLHRAGHVSRLTEVRAKMQVYVLPAFVDGRELAPYLPRASYTSRDIEKIKRKARARGWNEGTTAYSQAVQRAGGNFYAFVPPVNPYEAMEERHEGTDRT